MFVYVKGYLQLGVDEIKETFQDQTLSSKQLIRETPAFAQSDKGRTVANVYFVEM